MANTYTQIHLQFVFAVKYRKALILPDWQELLYQYITGIIQHNEHKMLQINGMPDHIHAFVGLRPAMAISDLARDIKNNSSKFINEKGFVKGKFSWQEGYGVFSYSHSQIGNVYDYILNQEEHHKKKTFKEEYLEFLEKFEIGFDEKYLFEWYD